MNIKSKISAIMLIAVFVATVMYMNQVITWAKEDKADRIRKAQEYCANLQDNPEELAINLVQIDAKRGTKYCTEFLHWNNSGVYNPSTPKKNPDPSFRSANEYKRLVKQLEINPNQQDVAISIIKEYLSTGKLLDISEYSTNSKSHNTPHSTSNSEPHAVEADIY